MSLNGAGPSRMLNVRYKMFVAAFSCFVLHGLIHLRLRGNMSMKGWRMTFYRQPQERPTGRNFDDKGMSIARQMLL